MKILQRITCCTRVLRSTFSLVTYMHNLKVYLRDHQNMPPLLFSLYEEGSLNANSSSQRYPDSHLWISYVNEYLCL